MLEKIVISIGGSVLISNDNNVLFLRKLMKLLRNLSKKYKLYIVIGGGNTARRYIKMGREAGLKENKLDEIGIQITRVNALLISNILKISNKNIPTTIEEAEKIDKPIVIMGGTIPGHSTDNVGVKLAKKIGANRFIIATNVDGVFDKDPNKYSNAKKIPEIKIEELLEKYDTKWKSAGSNTVIDGPALHNINRFKLPTFVVNGKRLDQLEKSIKNQKFDGTIIKI